nr:peptidoglycan binding protein CsiV [Candidatus Coxiella mudrowiae]
MKPLPASQFLLKNEQTELNENLGYHTLLHLAWQKSIIHLPTHPMRIEGDWV